MTSSFGFVVRTAQVQTRTFAFVGQPDDTHPATDVTDRGWSRRLVDRRRVE
jgi:hypothetical protein